MRRTPRPTVDKKASNAALKEMPNAAVTISLSGQERANDCRGHGDAQMGFSGSGAAARARGRFFNLVDLVNQLEQEKARS